MFMGSRYGSRLANVNFQGRHNFTADQNTKGSSGPVQQASGCPLEPAPGQPVQRQRGAREEMGDVARPERVQRLEAHPDLQFQAGAMLEGFGLVQFT
jgi:hypothetical protein